MTAKNTFQDNAIRVISVIGLIAVLLLGAWGIIQLAFFIPTFLGNIGGSIAPKTETAKIATTTTQTPAVVAPVQEVQKPVVKNPARHPRRYLCRQRETAPRSLRLPGPAGTHARQPKRRVCRRTGLYTICY